MWPFNNARLPPNKGNGAKYQETLVKLVKFMIGTINATSPTIEHSPFNKTHTHLTYCHDSGIVNGSSFAISRPVDWYPNCPILYYRIVVLVVIAYPQNAGHWVLIDPPDLCA